MAEQFSALQDKHVEFIREQHIFFVGTAGAEGRVNVSPKGMDSFRVMDANRVAWLNMTGSGNESAAHVMENGRMTIMFCSFDRQPLIMRLYGSSRAVHPRDDQWQELIELFPPNPGARQVFDLQVDLVQTSCGYAVPYLDYQGERETLRNWSEKHGPSGIEDYWQEKNRFSLDGKDTGIDE
jgi:hypothetical protein